MEGTRVVVRIFNVCLNARREQMEMRVVMESTAMGIREQQCGTRKDTSCSDPIFVIGQLSEKMKKKKVAFYAFMDLEKHMAEWTRRLLWQVVEIYGPME